ncbi:MAG TPA: hypothetical protein DEA73_06780 [Peptococcaceae bacterium]|nr:MAG: hypothetical protein XD51_0984 [Moorella sp. 60_41]HBT47567.1 hypothetical protein [Peptococcaceae bacterium]
MKSELRRLGEERKILWQGYLDLVAEQHRVLTLGLLEELGPVLDRKDRAIEELAELETRWEYRREAAALEEDFYPGDLEALEGEIRALVERAREMERASLELAEGLRNQVRNKLAQVRQARTLIAAYGDPSGPVQGAFLDKTR